MAARAPRRRFSALFVVTLGALPGCHPSPAANALTAADPEEHWTVSRNGPGCSVVSDCSPPPTPGQPVVTSCNPPPPRAYACPTDMGTTPSLPIVHHHGATTCEVAGTTPPEIVPCPT